MKVVINDQTLFVGWKYPNPQLEHMMVLHGLHPKCLKTMTQPQICLALGLKAKDIPVPPTTECIILDTGKEVVTSASVKRFYKDPYNKEKARKYSLSKALHNLYPNPHIPKDGEPFTAEQIKENEAAAANRKIFWDVYLSRKVSKIHPITAPVVEHQEV